MGSDGRQSSQELSKRASMFLQINLRDIIKYASFLFFCIFIFIGCRGLDFTATPWLDPDIRAKVKALEKYEKADTIADLQRALKNDDLRFLAIQHIGYQIPEMMDTDSIKYVTTYGFKVIEGTSDYRINRKYQRLMGLTREYATKYNQLLKKHILSIEHVKNRQGD